MKPLFKSIVQLKSYLSLPILLLLFASLTTCSSATISSQTLPDSANSALHSNFNDSDFNHTDSKYMVSTSKYQPESAKYKVENADNLSLTTPSGRKLPLKVYYPQAQGKFPVIIFSHGAAGSKDFYSLLGSFWASNGYVVIHPTHADSVFLPGGQFTPEHKDELVEYTLETPQAWKERAADISQIIDSLDEITTQAPQLQGKLDEQNIGVGGHSYGAYTTQLIGGATINIPNGSKNQSYADKRVKALLMLSPQGRGQQGLNDLSWKSMTLPAMFMTGSKDMGATTGEGPDWRQEPFEFVPPGDKYLLFIQDANHLSFSGRLTGEEGAVPQSANNSTNNRGSDMDSNRRNGNNSGGKLRDRIREQLMKRRIEQKFGSGDQKAIFGYVEAGSLAFWDAHLKNDASAKRYLTEKTLESSSDGEVTVNVK
jgi:predicted dienelactone hydrolase